MKLTCLSSAPAWESFLFLHCLHFAVVDSDYSFVILKPKQVLCLEAVFAGRDLLTVLPTGYGKSIIFHLLPALLLEKNRRSTSLLQVPPPVVVIISPLNSLIHDQIRRINTVRNRAAVLSFTRPMEADKLWNMLYSIKQTSTSYVCRNRLFT